MLLYARPPVSHLDGRLLEHVQYFEIGARRAGHVRPLQAFCGTKPIFSNSHEIIGRLRTMVQVRDEANFRTPSLPALFGAVAEAVKENARKRARQTKPSV
jgi:hypothetical protein